MPFWKKTNKGGKKKPPKPTVPRTAQQSIPMQRMFEDGTCRVKANYYTRTIQYQDINYQLAQPEDRTAIFEEWCSFLNFFDSSIKFELSFVNMATDSTEFEKSIRIPYQKDGFDDVRAEYSQMLRQQLAKGNNGLTKTKFITFGILERISKDSLTHKEEVFTRLYRYLLRPDIYYQAYQRLYTNKGASTKGINQDTADGFSEAKIEKIIQSLADETYQPTPVRRTYIAKKSNPKKKRPLGIPTFTDKLVQEALRMILEAIYEPLFLDCSHGFRPKRSCHTALDKLKYQFGGVRWFVEGDIKGCFDNINHDALVGFIGSKVKDARIVKLVYKFLKAGYLEDWVYHKTYSGTPQGGILSPLLANIYLHELDKFVMQLKDEFDTPEKGKITPEYRELHNRIKNLCYHIDRKNGVERESMIAECKTLRKQLLKTPCTAQTDKKLKYIRYADAKN